MGQWWRVGMRADMMSSSEKEKEVETGGGGAREAR